MIGFALDGFPITGPKVGTNNILTTSDLDECHGITSTITLDGKPVETYHYVMTQDFPYSASCFRSTAAQPPGQPAGRRAHRADRRQDLPADARDTVRACGRQRIGTPVCPSRLVHHARRQPHRRPSHAGGPQCLGVSRCHECGVARAASGGPRPSTSSPTKTIATSSWPAGVDAMGSQPGCVVGDGELRARATHGGLLGRRRSPTRKIHRSCAPTSSAGRPRSASSSGVSAPTRRRRSCAASGPDHPVFRIEETPPG